MTRAIALKYLRKVCSLKYIQSIKNTEDDISRKDGRIKVNINFNVVLLHVTVAFLPL